MLEVPGVLGQGRNTEEAREMSRDALLLMLETNREETEKETEDREVLTRGTLRV